MRRVILGFLIAAAWIGLAPPEPDAPLGSPAATRNDRLLNAQAG
jgi:hypothetical protein